MSDDCPIGEFVAAHPLYMSDDDVRLALGWAVRELRSQRATLEEQAAEIEVLRSLVAVGKR